MNRFLASACLVACVLALPARAALADQVVPTSPLTDGAGRAVGFYTNEAGVYFLTPSHWDRLDGARTPPVRLTPANSGCNNGPCHNYDLRLTLSPDYAYAVPTVVSVIQQDPDALFFPLPSSIDKVSLFLPPALGGIEAELVPDEQGMTTPVALYYRLRIDETQLEILTQLARSGLTLQGTVRYSYLGPGGSFQTASAPILVPIRESDLMLTAAPTDPTAWLGDLLATQMMSIPGAIDGSYALTTGLAVQISNSLVEGHFLPGTWALSHDGVSIIQLTPTAAPDYAGTYSFDVLGFHVWGEYQASVGVALELFFMEVTLPQFTITNITVNGASGIYTFLLRSLLSSATVRDKIAAVVTEELQRRILSQTLFGL